jgi:Ca2+-binding RTX toxin-like protein
VSFTGNETTQVVTIRVRGDIDVEGNEAFTVGLSDAQGGTIKIGRGTAVGTITNDDDQPAHVNGNPTGITLNGPGAAAEYAAAGTVVGTFSASDPDSSDTFSYALVGTNDRFDVVGGQLVVKNGFKLDYEQVTSHQVMVRVTDQSNATFDRAFTIGVIDITGESTAGSAANDIFKGGAGTDKLGGGLGDDTLWGSFGKDILTGNAGHDIFVFNTKLNKKTNLDKIADFNVKDDSIWLDNAIFKKLGKKGSEAGPGKLSKSFFTVGAAAKDKNDYLVYDKKKAILYYDSDGSGKAKAVEIATLKKNLKMTYKDFFII